MNGTLFGSERSFLGNRSEQSEVSECLLNRCNLFWRARILVVGRAGCGEPEQLFAMCNPGTFGHKAMLAGVWAARSAERAFLVIVADSLTLGDQVGVSAARRQWLPMPASALGLA
jgi:hypothetical protein